MQLRYSYWDVKDQTIKGLKIHAQQSAAMHVGQDYTDQILQEIIKSNLQQTCRRRTFVLCYGQNSL